MFTNTKQLKDSSYQWLLHINHQLLTLILFSAVSEKRVLSHKLQHLIYKFVEIFFCNVMIDFFHHSHFKNFLLINFIEHFQDFILMCTFVFTEYHDWNLAFFILVYSMMILLNISLEDSINFQCTSHNFRLRVQLNIKIQICK